MNQPANQPVSLSPERQFRQRLFEDDVKRMNLSEAQEFLITIHRQMLAKDELYQNLIKQSWGISSCQKEA